MCCQSVEGIDERFMKTDMENVSGCTSAAGSSKTGRKKRCALVLAGGRSSRMGSDKALLRPGGPNGETFLERAVRFWQESEVADRVLVAVGSPGHLEPLPKGAEAVYDLVKDQGPMSGLLSAFRQTDAELLYVSAVDMPNLRKEAILPVPPEDKDAIVYLLDGRPEPLFGVYRRSVSAAAEKLLLSGRGKMSLLLEEVRTEYREIPSHLEDIFFNVNTKEDLEKIIYLEKY